MIQQAETMKSPITGGRVTLHREWREMDFRKEKYRVMFPYYRCEDTGEQFTTTESDGVWYTQLHNQYCRKYGIPYVDEIISTRRRYGLSAAKMSLILGFGPNQWRKYEQEEIPNVSNGRMIRSIMNPKVFLDLAESSRGMLTDREYDNVVSRVNGLTVGSDRHNIEKYESSRIYATERGPENGFGQLSLPRLKNILLYVLDHGRDVWCTKMNKLLFYIDFVAYRETGTAVTGLSYRAIDYGPVPERWERTYSSFDDIRQDFRMAGEHEGIMLLTDKKPDETLFSPDELTLMQMVCNRFGDLSSAQLTSLSHQEQAWTDNFGNRGKIPYESAFSIRNI